MTTAETLSYYTPVLFIFFVGLLPFWFIIELKFLDSYDGVRSAKDMFNISWPLLLLGSFIAAMRWFSLKMRKIKIDYSDKDFNEALNRTIRQLNWHVRNNNQQVFVACRYSDRTERWGERITILKLNDGLMLNSIGNPDVYSSFSSFGWNKKNLETFLKNLEDVKNSIPAKKQVAKINKEWTFQRIVVRLIAYPFCLLLIGLGVYMIFNPINWKSNSAGIGAIGIALVYLYSDLKIILKKQ